MNEDLLALLVCPRCHGELKPIHSGDGILTGLDCLPCRLRFPVEDDIPVMLLEEALPLPEGEEKGSRTEA